MVKQYIHARLSSADQKALDKLKNRTGQSESELVRQGLQLMLKKELGEHASALDLVKPSIGKFASRYRDLSTNPRHMQGFGK